MTIILATGTKHTVLPAQEFRSEIHKMFSLSNNCYHYKYSFES